MGSWSPTLSAENAKRVQPPAHGWLNAGRYLIGFSRPAGVWAAVPRILRLRSLLRHISFAGVAEEIAFADR